MAFQVNWESPLFSRLSYAVYSRMNQGIHQSYPASYLEIEVATNNSGFTMASEPLTGSLLRTLAASKPKGKFLELGTGTGLSTSWILDGMDAESTLTTVDFDDKFLKIAKQFLGHDARLSLELSDGEQWILKNKDLRFEYIFADTWHGKYLLLNETLDMLNPGAFYIVDDMLTQPNWPDGHAEKAEAFVEQLERRQDLHITKQSWATGIIIAVKK